MLSSPVIIYDLFYASDYSPFTGARFTWGSLGWVFIQQTAVGLIPTSSSWDHSWSWSGILSKTLTSNLCKHSRTHSRQALNRLSIPLVSFVFLTSVGVPDALIRAAAPFGAYQITQLSGGSLSALCNLYLLRNAWHRAGLEFESFAATLAILVTSAHTVKLT